MFDTRFCQTALAKADGVLKKFATIATSLSITLRVGAAAIDHRLGSCLIVVGMLASTVTSLTRNSNGGTPSIYDDSEALAPRVSNADGGEVHTVALFVYTSNFFVKTTLLVVMVVGGGGGGGRWWRRETVPPLSRGVRSRHGTTMHGE